MWKNVFDFEKQTVEVNNLEKDLYDAQLINKKVLASSSDNKRESFREKMAEVITKSDQDFIELKELLKCAKEIYRRCMQFDSFTPKKGKVEDAKLEEFFSICYPFCDNFKNIWKKAQVKIQIKQAKEKRDKYVKKESIQNVEIKKKSAFSFKNSCR